MEDLGIQQRLIEVRQRILRAIERSNRNCAAVKLLTVSKTQPIQKIQEAYQVGQRAFAENRIQEWQEKVSHMPDDCEWHIMGRLQTNKVKYLNDKVALIHSLDRLSLLEALNEHGRRQGLIWAALVQVNIARDPAKAGLAPEEVPDFLNLIKDYPFVNVRGLMTIGALEASLQDTREFFRQLRNLRDSLQSRSWPGVDLRDLSMGMSRDFELAIEEGATLVRVGRQIFGERG
ncbi:YggS family pyridoxal phosphate-dependent enzyme [Desulfosporosinus sp. FKA]|uniref:YggS family pyridoxal phosphate-dependent enzyme n=1 Tax=Desulfosporosinus sp. FKA TaxID=1969834 RepID=UPI000B498A3B|nr:YggS family pyridoxal phosphate-dependent enzyme [Desulfosporosinus sp. FKA]